jgi:hypothetical protein
MDQESIVLDVDPRSVLAAVKQPNTGCVIQQPGLVIV